VSKNRGIRPNPTKKLSSSGGGVEIGRKEWSKKSKGSKPKGSCRPAGLSSSVPGKYKGKREVKSGRY